MEGFVESEFGYFVLAIRAEVNNTMNGHLATSLLASLVIYLIQFRLTSSRNPMAFIEVHNFISILAKHLFSFGLKWNLNMD